MERKTRVPKALAKKRREKTNPCSKGNSSPGKKKGKQKKQLTLAQRVCCWPSWLSLIKGLSFSARFFNPSTAGMAVKKPVGNVWVECFFFFTWATLLVVQFVCIMVTSTDWNWLPAPPGFWVPQDLICLD